MVRLGSRWRDDPEPAEQSPAAIRVAAVTAFLDRRLQELGRAANASGEPSNREAVNVCLDALALLRPDGSRMDIPPAPAGRDRHTKGTT
jgi:hypothetical protein